MLEPPLHSAFTNVCMARLTQICGYVLMYFSHAYVFHHYIYIYIYIYICILAYVYARIAGIFSCQFPCSCTSECAVGCLVLCIAQDVKGKLMATSQFKALVFALPET